VSDSCNYHLDMQWDGNLVLYEGVGNQASQYRWSTAEATTTCLSWPYSGCQSNIYPFPFPDPVYAILQSDGNFVEYDTAGDVSFGGYPTGVRWDAGSVVNTATQLWVQDDGNLVVYKAALLGQPDGAAFATNTAGSTAAGPRDCPIHTEITTIDQDSVFTFANSTFNSTACAFDAMTCGDDCTRLSGSTCAGWTWIPDASADGLSGCATGEGMCLLWSAVGGQPVFEPGCVSGVIEHP
jgi:hypothetical protein